MDYAQIPNYVNMTISSGGNSKSYRLNDQEYNEYSNYKDQIRSLVGGYLCVTSSCLVISCICVILLLFQKTRFNAFISILVIVVLYFSYTEYLESEKTKNDVKMNKLLD